MLCFICRAMARTTSCCVISRSSPRSVPSTRRKYRIFSPSRISQSVINISQIAIGVNTQKTPRLSACGERWLLYVCEDLRHVVERLVKIRGGGREQKGAYALGFV